MIGTIIFSVIFGLGFLVFIGFLVWAALDDDTPDY